MQIPYIAKSKTFITSGATKDEHGKERQLPGVHNYWAKDTKQLLHQSLTTQPPDWHYRKQPVTYTVNSLGYRAPEFDQVDWKNSVVIFGCSNTFGDGVDDSETISAQLSNIIGKPVINMGSGASSQEFSLHNNIILKEHYGTPLAVVNYWTSIYRYTMYNNTPIPAKLSTNDYQKFDYKTCWFQEGNPETRTYFINLLAKHIWKNDTIYYDTTWCIDTHHLTGCDFMDGTGIDLAREMSHPGPKDNKHIATRIANNLAQRGLKF